eukprot:CCRYP_004541-RA/>CCRYP_004541-RA protein AED:0.01 eAED:0.01 QI:185/1/1/1/1/1/2/3046/717
MTITTEPLLRDPTDPESISTYFQTLRPVIHIIDAAASHHDASENNDHETIHHANPQNDHAALDPPPSHASLRTKFMEALGYEDPTQHNNGSSSALPGVTSNSSSSLLRRAHVQTLPSLSSCHPVAASRYPTGKDDAATLAPSGTWFTAIHIAHEGILNHHWMVKHALRLPSSMVVMATAVEDRGGMVEESALVERLATTVDELRSNLAEKRGGAGIVHVVCLVSSRVTAAKSTATGTTAEARGEKILRQHRDAAFRERVGSSCRLSSQQVHVLRGGDLERDEWEERVANSPYAAGGGGILATNLPTNNNEKTTIYMSPALRTVCTALLQCSTRYYLRLAEMAERKLATWRNRYHTTNTSFEVNTLVCVVRCGRYAVKAGVFREMEHRCGSGASGGGGAGAAAMRHYEESYRWIVELQRRIVRWRGGGNASAASSAAAAAASWSNNPPITPGAATTHPTNEFSSPRFIESPGGGIGVELTLPTVAEMPLPPVSHGTPATTYRRSSSSGGGGGGSSSTPQSYYSSSLSLQCQAVASLLNYKLLQLPTTLLELELQWRRHRSAFLLQTVLADWSIAPTRNASPPPSWHRLQYCHNEMQTYATAAERIWRNDATLDPRSLSVEYHSAAAPWKIYGELAEVMLALGREVRGRLMRDAWKDPEEEVVEDEGEERRRFVGSIVEGVGVGGWQWYFEMETKRNHRGEVVRVVPCCWSWYCCQCCH